MLSTLFLVNILLFLCSLSTLSARPTAEIRDLDEYYNLFARSKAKRTVYFPDTPESCPICAKDYDNINSCAEASSVFANFSTILFNPGGFVDVIKCACTDTFQSAFPQCVDCFQKTNQTWALDQTVADPNDVVNGMRKVCALASTLIGNVSNTNGETTPIPTGAAAPAASSNSATMLSMQNAMAATTVAVIAGVLGLVLS
ncbi:hypothetical protein DL96DRAFT_1524084 [Flagelloscypha sp. PMI_526]|nr:hypothetical protein DL96DRAFT_1524084 [Flagelloscypha sp. PMI_526]